MLNYIMDAAKYVVQVKDNVVRQINQLHNTAIKAVDSTMHYVGADITFTRILQIVKSENVWRNLGFNNELKNHLWLSGVSNASMEIREGDIRDKKFVENLLAVVKDETAKIKMLEEAYQQKFKGRRPRPIEIDKFALEKNTEKLDKSIELLKQRHKNVRRNAVLDDAATISGLGNAITKLTTPPEQRDMFTVPMAVYTVVSSFVNLGKSFLDSKNYHAKLQQMRSAVLEYFECQARVQAMVPELKKRPIDGKLAENLLKKLKAENRSLMHTRNRRHTPKRRPASWATLCASSESHGPRRHDRS